MMILHLVKKDFLIAKKYVLFMMGFTAVIPMFVVTSVPAMTGTGAFIYTVIFTVIIILQSAAMEEAKHPKAIALLCAAPYSRKSFVMAKYACFFILFAYCYAVYCLLGVIFTSVEMVGLSALLAVLMFGTVIYSVFLPVYFKLGFEKTKFIFLIAIPVFAFGTPIFFNFYPNLNFSINMLALLPVVVINIAMISVGFVTLVVSVNLSIKIFSRKEL